MINFNRYLFHTHGAPTLSKDNGRARLASNVYSLAIPQRAIPVKTYRIMHKTTDKNMEIG